MVALMLHQAYLVVMLSSKSIVGLYLMSEDLQEPD